MTSNVTSLAKKVKNKYKGKPDGDMPIYYPTVLVIDINI